VTDAAPFTPIQICLKIAIGILPDATFRAINLTQTAFNASGKVIGRFLRTPIAGTILSGTTRFGDNTTDFKVLPG
jgi:hypothetical protein